MRSISARTLSRGGACHRQLRKVTLEAGLDVLTRKNIQDRGLKKKGSLPSETQSYLSYEKTGKQNTSLSEEHAVGGLKGTTSLIAQFALLGSSRLGIGESKHGFVLSLCSFSFCSHRKVNVLFA